VATNIAILAIKSENARPNAWIYVDLRGIDVGSYVATAKKTVEAKIKMPPGYTIGWSGQYEYMLRAEKRLLVVIPLTFFMIFMIIYVNTQSLIKTAIVFLAVPFSLVGAIWLLDLLDYNMSIAVWVGMIALAGLDAETGVVMLLYLDVAYENFKKRNLLNHRNDPADAIYDGAVKRVRPKVMTISVIVAGLLPILWSHGTGADVMKRIATPMVGGVVTSGVMELLIYPIIFYFWRSRGLPEGGPFAGFHHLKEEK
jgi:Cu(I)/Ag(I) efflux system membrane protein CusA/SilA